MNKTVRPFSAGYFIIDADILTHSGDEVVAPHDLYAELQNYVTRPLLRMSEEHYWASPEHGIPAKTVAVPEESMMEEDDPVLLAKDETTHRLVITGEKKKPA